MKVLATHRCIEIHQVVGATEKRLVETSFDMKLYDQEIIAKNHRYPIASVFDISYRKKKEEDTIGFLYLHTSRGVRTYYIRQEPSAFIAAYRALEKRHR